MRFLNFLFRRGTTEDGSPPVDFRAEIEGLSWKDIFLKALEEARKDKYMPLSERPRTWFAVSLEILSECSPSENELAAVANAIALYTAELYPYSSFDSWYRDIVKGLPEHLRDATIDAAEKTLTDDDYGVCQELIKLLGGQKAASFFARRKENWINSAKSKHMGSWNLLKAKCEHLEIVPLSSAEDFLRTTTGIQSIAPYYIDTTSWTLDTARHMFNIEDVLLRAVSETAANNGSFSQLAKDAEARRSPITHLIARHGWYQADDAFGTDIFYVLRVANDEYVCYDKESYG